MKKLFFLLIAIFLFANENPSEILKQIPKNSPDFNLAKAIVTKINTLQAKKIIFDTNIKSQWEYENKFLQLSDYKKELLNIPQKISDLENKINYLAQNKTHIAQLQILLYEKKLNLLNEKQNFLKKNLNSFEKQLFKKLNDVKFETRYCSKQVQYWKNLLLNKKKEEEKLKINLQKWEILSNTNNINLTQTYLNTNLKKQQTIYQNLINNQLIIWFQKLKNKDVSVFNLSKEIGNYALIIDNKSSKTLINLMYDFENFKFGSEMLIYNSKDEMKIVLSKITYFLNYPLFSISNSTITPINFIILVLIFVIGWFSGRYYKKLIYSVREKYDISYSTATLLANMGYYFILLITFLMALKSVGLNLSSLAIIAGALSVGIGFGLQNIVSNFVSGIIMMFEKSIKVGDYIQIDNDTRGEVVDISMRSTIIKTNDNINLIIPNQAFIQNNLINWTLGDDVVRFRVPFGVEYGSDIDKVEKVVLKALENSDLPFIKNHISIKKDISPQVIFLEMGDSSLNFELFVWVKGEYAKRPKGTKSQFLKLIYNALNEAGIEIPFPQQDLHIKNSTPFEIKIKKD